MRYLRTPQKNRTFYIPGQVFNVRASSGYAELSTEDMPGQPCATTDHITASEKQI